MDSFIIVSFIVIPPPVDVRATEQNSSSKVEVSWSPPLQYGQYDITGYRIFYGSEHNILVPSVMIISSVGLRVNESHGAQTVFLRSESGQLHSELVNVTVGEVLACLSQKHP